MGLFQPLKLSKHHETRKCLTQTLQLSQCSQAGNAFLASTKPRLVHQTARHNSVIHHFAEHSRIEWRHAFFSRHPTLGIMFGDVRFACLEMHFKKLPVHKFVLMLLPEKAASLHYVLQHLVTLPCDFIWSVNNTTYTWLWNIQQERNFMNWLIETVAFYDSPTQTRRALHNSPLIYKCLEMQAVWLGTWLYTVYLWQLNTHWKVALIA